MSNELELEKNVKKDEPVKSDDKAKKSTKNSSSKGKQKKSIVKYFKDARSEFKKVIRPSTQSVRNNKVVVIGTLIVSAIFIWGIDSLFVLLNNLILG